MNRVKWIVVATAMWLSPCAFATSFNSNGTGGGNWNLSTTWDQGASIPGPGDVVTILEGDTVFVTDGQSALKVIVGSGLSGDATLRIDAGGTLSSLDAGDALTVFAPSSTGTSIVQMNGGTLNVPNGNALLNANASNISRIEFTALGGTLDVGANMTFTSFPNAQVTFANAGDVNIAGNLGANGSITSTNSTFTFDGNGGQSILGSYTFYHLVVTKPTGTVTLNSPIFVNGDLSITSGVLDDGGNQITLNGAGTSTVEIDFAGVLKLGSAGSATFFPTPIGSTNFTPGSAVVYQSGVSQTIHSGFPYQRLFLTTLGGNVSHIQSGGSLTVNEELNVSKNGLNNTTFSLGTGILDANGDITGDGTIDITSGSVTVRGNWGSSSVLNAGSSTITYDGTGAQSMVPATYHHLVIDKSSGAATPSGNVTVNGNLTVTNGTFDAATNTVTLQGDLTNNAFVLASSATFILSGTGPQTWSSPSNSITVGTLQLNNVSDISIGNSTIVNSSLSLNCGKVTIGGSFAIDVLAVVTRTSGWFVGPLTMGMSTTPSRTFHIGTTAAYLPVDADAGSGGQLTIEAVEGKHPDRTGDNVLDRYWRIVAPSTIVPLDSVTFQYSLSDVTTGDETQYILAQYAALTFTHHSSVNSVAHTATATSVPGYVTDWVVGQPGSLAAASQLAITSINSGTDPEATVPFDVVVEAQDDNGDPADVFANTSFSLSEDNGTGTLGGTLTGTINAGTSTATVIGVTYDTAETGLLMRATRTAGDVLTDGTLAFDVVAPPSTITVTNVNDAGPGSLRAAITAANTGACTSPCTIEFSTAGTIILSSALPAIAVSNLTIDGYTAPGSFENTSAFGQPSNAVITLAIDGSANIPIGFDIQETFVKIKGFAIQNFFNGGSGIGVRFTGDNSGSSVTGCHIGTNMGGNTSAPNAYGVLFTASSESTVGGTAVGARNVISGNSLYGVKTDSAANTIGITGNYIGTNAALTSALPNNTGIYVCSGCSVYIGGASVGNVVSGNTATAIALAGGGTTLHGNIIGPAGDSALALPNATGVQIDAGSNFNNIGGNSPSDANVISGNSQNGILVNGDDNNIDNNLIGLAPDGTTPMANGGSGVRIETTASRNLIGVAFPNKIGANANDGVTIVTTSGIGNTVRTNEIAGNTSLAIDIDDDGITPNDATDADTGANNKQNFPVVSSAYLSGGNVTVKVNLNSSGGVSANNFVFDVYKSDGASQAVEHLGDSGCVAGNVFSLLTFAVPAGTVTAGDKVVATATAYSDGACTTPSEGTSELSASVTVGAEIHWIAASGNWETASNWSPAVVPTASDDVYIDNSGTYTVSINSLASANSVHVGDGVSGTQTLNVNVGSSLTVAAASDVATTGALSLSGTIGGTGAIGVSGTFDWLTGTLTGTGGLTMNAGATLNFNSASAKAINGPLLTISAGAIANWSGGPINLLNGGAIDNFGTFDIKSDANINDSGSAGAVANHGTFRKTTTSGTTNLVNVTFNHNGGTLDIQTGTLNVAGGTAIAPITISGGATLLIDDNTYILAAGSSMTGAGKIHVSAGTLNVSGPSVTIEHLLLAGSGTLTGTGTATTGPAGSWQWDGGTMSGSGSSVIENTASIGIFTASAHALTGRTLTIQSGGTAAWNGGGNINLSSGGTIVNGGIFDAVADGAITDAGSDGGFTNNNIFKKSGGAGSTVFTSVDLTNSGTIQVQTGTLNPGTLTSTGNIDLTGTLLVDDSTVTLNAGTDVLGTGLLHVTAGTLAANAIDTLPNVQIDGGSFQGSANVSITSLTWTNGIMEGTGTTTIPSGGTATISGASVKTLRRTLGVTNGGTVNVTGGGSINFQSGGNIANDGLVQITVGVVFADAGTGGDFVNTRTFRVNSAGPAQFANITFDNSGGSALMDLIAGSIDLADGTSTGTISLGAGTTLFINSDTYTFAPGTTVTGSGNLNLLAGTLIVSGNVSVPTFNMSGGTLDGVGTLSLPGTANWTGGTMQGAGTTDVTATGTLTLGGAAARTLSRTLSSAAGAAINLTGTGTINLSGGGNVSNGGTFTVSADQTFNDAGSAGNFVNTGTFRKDTTSGSTVFTGIGFTNSGLTDLQRGILTVNGDTFSQLTGTLKSWLNGTVPGVGFGQLTTNQTPTLGGTLEIALVGLYQPVGGDTFRVLSATAHSGDFNQPYTYPALTGGRTFSDAYDAGGLLLTVSGNADLSIAKSAPSNNVVVGGAIAYTLTVDNLGPDIANSVSVTDNLPSGHTNISAIGTGWTCNVVGDLVTCTAATLPVGTAPAITINADAPVTPQTFINFANVTSSNDPNNTNDQANWTITVDPNQADLDVSAVSPSTPLAPGTPFTFDFQIENDGPQTATNVVFSAPVPSTLTYNSATPDAGVCNFSAGTITCNLGNIALGNNLHVVVNLTTTGTAGTHQVTGTATATEADPLPSNNSIAPAVEVTGTTITVINTNDAGMGSLREALQDAGNGTCTPLPCTIAFNIPGGPFVIQPLTALPGVPNQTTVDATTQPGYSGIPIIQIDGSAVAAALSVTGNNAAVKGFSVTGAAIGIEVSGDGNTIAANYAGLTPAGTAAANGNGVEVTGDNNTIGGTAAADRNVISGNTGVGVLMAGSATGNTVAGNYIGTDPAGTAARANNTGVSIIDEADSNAIGGATTAHRNVISGNTLYGIYINGAGSGSIAGSVGTLSDGDGLVEDTTIHNNYIGPTATGTASLPAIVSGITIDDNAGNTVIGAAGTGNVISGNVNGISILNSGVTGTQIDGNLIGVAPDGTTPMGNSQAGVFIGSSDSNSIGQSAPNAIANSGGDGVAVQNGTQNVILSNQFFNNGDLGIDLGPGGATPNDATDADSGANGLQNSPTLTMATLIGGGDVHIEYNIDSSGSSAGIGSIGFDVYEADPSGEGQTLLIGNNCFAGNTIGAGTSWNAPSVALGDSIVLTATSYTDAACTTVADGTSEFSNTLVVTNCTPPAVTITGPTAICGPGSVVLDAGPGFASYLWSNGATTQQISVSPASTTSYTVTVTDNIGCPNSDSHTVTVNTPPAVTITGPTAMCAGGSVVLDAGAGFAVYAWSNGATTQQITVSPGSTATFNVTVTDGNGCQGTDSHTVTVNGNPTVTITGPTATCAGTPVTLDAGPGFASYAWSTGATTQQITVNPGSTASYTVTVSDGTCTATDTHTVTVNPVPTATIAPSGPTTFCAGGSVTLTASAGSSWLWSNGAVTQSINVNTSGTFTVQVFNASGCSATSAPVTTTAHPPTVVTITGPTATCAGTPVTLDAGPGFAGYAWSTGATTQQITVNPGSTASYSVTVTDGNGCTATDSHTVTVTPNPTATISAAASVCETSTGNTASVASQAGATYNWTIGNGVITAGNGTNAITFTAGAGGSVTLGVTVINGGCTTNGNTTIPITATPTVTITGPASSCGGVPVTLDAGPGFATYLWSNGATSQTITVAPASTTAYSVTVGSGGSCTATDSHTVTILGNPLANIIAPSSVPSGDTGLTASVEIQAGATYAWSITNGTITAGNGTASITFDAGTSGSTVLNVTVTINGCSAGDTHTVLIEAGGETADLAVTKSAPATVPAGGNLTYTIGVTNNGPNAAVGVVIDDTFPSGVSFVSVNGGPWICTPNANGVRCVGDAAPGASSVITINATAPQQAGTITNTVGISAVTADPNLANNIASATTTVIVIPDECQANGAPQIVAPPSGATVGSPTMFLWTPVPQAIGYRLWIEVDGGAPQSLGTTDGAITLTVGLPEGSIVAYVDALFAVCPPTRSAPITLNVPRTDPCASRPAATQLSPPNDAVINSSSVDFSWSPVAGALEYRVWVSVDGAQPMVVGTTPDTFFRATLSRGTVLWWIETTFPGCASTESPRRRFTIPARGDCTQARPDLIAPAQNSTVTNGNVTFSWTAVPGAVLYELWLSIDHGTPALLGSTDATQINHLVPPGRLEWFIRTYVDRCGPRDSQKFRFTFDVPDACLDRDRPIPIAPIDGAKVTSPVSFSWHPVPGATGYDVFVMRNNEGPTFVGSTQSTQLNGVELIEARLRWFVRANFGGGCPSLDSPRQAFETVPAPPACATLTAPVLSAPGQISSGVPFLVQWTPVVGATGYELQLASGAGFEGAQTVTTTATQHELVRTNGTNAPVAVHARVRALDADCAVPAAGAFGPGAAIFILPNGDAQGSAPLTGGVLTFTLPLGPQFAGQTFTAVPKQPWLTVAPASGVVAEGGTNLVVTANATGLPVGTSLGAVAVTLNSAAGGTVSTNDSTIVTPNFSVTLVTPVSPVPGSTPPPDALIIPAVAHANGINAQFQSDVRVANTSPELITYQVTFTPSGDSGITQGQQSTFSVEPGQTVALDDILKSWFGTGNGTAFGSLEIRPVTQTSNSTFGGAFAGLSNFVSFASSRTFNVTSNGTFGQYIPAVPFANFIGGAAPGAPRTVLSLQQIAQSALYRTNLGLLEGSGQPADLLVRVFGADGQALTDFPVHLNGGQHLQLGSFLLERGFHNLNDGRVEVEVQSESGKVTAYASVLDNQTNDPLLVTPVTITDSGDSKWVVPGVADVASGFANWQTDMRLFNAGLEPIDATLQFFSMGGGAPRTKTVTLQAGEVKQYDKVLASLFETANDAGAVHVTTSLPARLVATARTYNQTNGGTYGQFISGVTLAETAGIESRPLQLLQIEESNRFRSNIGLVEVTGHPVKLEISVVPPDNKFSVSTELTLNGNEFRQLGSLLASFQLQGTHNARVTVRVIEGTGRVTAYASVIDMLTNDPTYVPAQ